MYAHCEDFEVLIKARRDGYETGSAAWHAIDMLLGELRDLYMTGGG